MFTGQKARLHQIADVLNDLEDSCVRFIVKKVLFSKAFDRESIKTPIIRLIQSSRDDQVVYYI